MARRKSSHRAHRAKHTRGRSRRTKHTRRRHTRRVRRTRRGGDGSIGTPYPAERMMPLRQNQTLAGGYFSRANQIGGGLIPPGGGGGGGGIGRHTGGNVGGTLQPSGSVMIANRSNGQMSTNLVTGGRA